MSTPSTRFAPQVTPLEDRTTPTTVPFQETLTLVGQSPEGVLSYVGYATQFGRVTATLDVPNGNQFVKVAANGDTAFGFVTHASPTTGSITLTGGTGRFTGITGDSTYVISVNGTTTTVSVTGTLDRPDLGGGQGGSVTMPFSLSGGGPAPFGIPLFAGGSAPHSSTGVTNLLGRHTGEGTFTVESLNIDPNTGAVTGTFSGSYTFTAANGDKLVMKYGVGGTGVFSGQISADGSAVTGVVFDAVFVVDSAASTGRFEGATGGFRMIARAASVGLIPGSPYSAPFDYTWEGDGTISLAKGKK